LKKQWNRPGRLAAAGLKTADREEARTRIWASLSNAARRGEIEKHRQRRGGIPMAEVSKKEHDEAYLYSSSGIRERHGIVPVWLQFVVIALIVWGIYYLIQFWNF
jgi:hypothetical protein